MFMKEKNEKPDGGQENMTPQAAQNPANGKKSEKKKSGLAREGISYLKMDPIPAQTIAWVAAVLFAFVTNKWWVFESHTLNPVKVWKEFVSFVLCRVATFLFNLAALYVMVDLMKMEFFVCKLLISVVVVVLNYVFSKILIFTGDKKK